MIVEIWKSYIIYWNADAYLVDLDIFGHIYFLRYPAPAGGGATGRENDL